MYRTYLEATLPSIMGKNGCKKEKRNDKRKRRAEIHVVKLKAMNIVNNLWPQDLMIDSKKLNEALFDLSSWSEEEYKFYLFYYYWVR